jgi:hypothetical protein
MKTPIKKISVLAQGVLGYFGYDYFQNKAGTNNNPSGTTYDTMGTTNPNQFTTNYNFGDLFGSGQGTASTQLLSPSQVLSSLPSDVNTASVSTGSSSSGSSSGSGGYVVPTRAGGISYANNVLAPFQKATKNANIVSTLGSLGYKTSYSGGL